MPVVSDGYVPDRSIDLEPQRLHAARSLASAALVLVLFGLLTSTTQFWQGNGPVFIPSGSYSFIPAIVLMVLAMLRCRGAWRELLVPSEKGFALGLLLIFVSDWFDRSYNFFPNPSVRGEVVFFGILFLSIGAALQERLIKWLLPCSAIALAATFLAESGGRLLYSDDHPSFLFRLSMLKEQFPQIPFYYPLWNAGLDARDFFATGSLGSFFLFSPLIYLFDVSSIYNFLIAAILFVVFPLSVYFAARTEALRPAAQAIAGLLALCIGLVWYRWSLKYGTMGFVLSAALAPLNLALAMKLLEDRAEHSWRFVLLFVTTCTLMLLWSASGLVFLPLAVLALGILVQRWRKGVRPIIGKGIVRAGLLLVLINLPWMTLFWSVSNVSRFLSTDRPAVHSASVSDSKEALAPLPQDGAHRGFRNREGGLDVKKSLAIVREKAFSTNPLVLFFALPGLYLLRRRSLLAFAVTGLWLLFLGSIMVPIKPQLELDRMLLVATVLMSIPAGAAIERLLSASGSFGTKALQALTAGFLIVSPFCTGSILANRTVDQYHFADTLLPSLAQAIRTLGGDGRTVFSGCIVHELEEGHIAPLTIWTGKELVASAPFHTLWRYTQVIPKSFMQRGDAGIEEYLTLMNATSVVTHEREWREYFTARPSLYALVWRQDRFSLFERIGAVSNPFLAGAGTLLERSTNSLRVRVESTEATLKYNYFPFLEASGCDITAAEVAPELRFIRLENCTPGQEVLIRAGSPWRRIFG